MGFVKLYLQQFEHNSKKQVVKEEQKLVLNNSSGQVENSTTVIGNNSDALKSIVIEDMGYSDSETFPAEITASVVKDTNLVTLKVKAVTVLKKYYLLFMTV